MGLKEDNDQSIAGMKAVNNVGPIPANKWARLRTVNNTGAPTFTFRSSQATLL